MSLPHLVLLHGWGVNSQIWNSLLPALRRSFEVVEIDLPGYGRDHAFDEEYSLDRVIERIMESAPAQAHWVAWSLGATLAMQAALHDANRFISLQLISATPKFMNDDEWKFGMEQAPLEAIESRICVNYQRGLKRFLHLQTDNRILSRALFESITEMSPPSTQTLSNSLRLLTETDLRSSIGTLRAKTQIVAGASDQIVSPAASRWLADHIPDAEWLLIESEVPNTPVGHLPFLENSAAWLESIWRFTGTESR